ncbi:YIP1 family protein [Hyalangium versicolor]|uniref:YIP1 family protein n=1 Tax=Hyalangium versicolor TaxID=2861190 RepID=UPI001CCAD0D3|nr:YIP1 family protein [Hyalangium versicolor]
MSGMESSLQAACAIHPEHQALQICSRCGTFACEQCLRDSPPGESLCSACVAREERIQLPWENRRELGFVRAWFKSVGPIMLSPRKTFASMKPSGDVGGALLFAAIANLFGYFTTMVLFTISSALVLPEPPNSAGSPIPLRYIILSTYGVLTVASPLFGLAAAVLMAALDHLVLRMIGKPQPLETTLRAASYAQAPLVIGLLPVCSLYIAPFWCLVTKVFAYRGMHRTSTGVALGGALLVPAILSVAFCGFYALMFALIAGVSGFGK